MKLTPDARRIYLPYKGTLIKCLFRFSSVLREKTRNFTCLLVSLVYGLTSQFAWAACADLSKVTNWSNINTHKIIIYQDSKAIVILDIPYCEIYPSSSITLNKEYICDLDKIIVSGKACEIRNVSLP
jgi:hypothetical protein